MADVRRHFSIHKANEGGAVFDIADSLLKQFDLLTKDNNAWLEEHSVRIWESKRSLTIQNANLKMDQVEHFPFTKLII